MANFWNAGQFATQVTKLAEMDIPDLGADSTTQNSYIYSILNEVLWHYARIAFIEVFSDTLNITADGYVQFKTGSSLITDMLEPEKLLDMGTTNEAEIQKRVSYSASKGWWRGAQNQDIHVRGLNGNYKLVYLRYPKIITIDSDLVEFPPTGYHTLVMGVISVIKFVKNSYAGSDFFDAKSKAALGEAAQAAMSARGTGSSGQPIGAQDVLIGRGG